MLLGGDLECRHSRRRGIGVQPVEHARAVGFGETEHGGDVAGEVDQQRRDVPGDRNR